jgi:hypothetical protein
MKRPLPTALVLVVAVSCAPATRTATRSSRAPVAHAPASPPTDGGSDATSPFDALCRPAGDAGAARGRVLDEDDADDRASGYSLSESRSRPEEGTCGVADSNLTLAEKEILAAPEPARAARRAAWDGVTPPKHWGLVTGRVYPTANELALLRANGFVALERVPVASYAKAYHDIFQMQLPVFVTVDSILHSVFASHDTMLARLEERRAGPVLARTLTAMHCALPGAAAEYGDETARDVDLYLTVARKLLDRGATSLLGTDDEVSSLVERAEKADGLEIVQLFGRARAVDFSAYRPRGHYAREYGPLPEYFRASTWLSRLELNLVSRFSRSSHPEAVPDPRETPREATLALALADLVDRAGVGRDLAALEDTWSLFAGKREDVSVPDLTRLRAKASIADLRAPDAAARLRAAIGDGFKRTVRAHFMPQGSGELPVIATLLGVRAVGDAAATRPLVHSDLPGRHTISAADMAYAHGQDHALRYLAADRKKFPELDRALADARGIVQRRAADDDLYASWQRVLIALGAPARGATPSFVDRDAYRDFRLDSTIVGFGQLRHNHVLLAAQGHDSYGCEIPDGYVEPAPALFHALAAFAARGAALAARVDAKDASGASAYFARLGRVMRVLARIAEHELTGAPLAEPERRYLAMVAEFRKGGSDGRPKYTGYYFDLFLDRREDSRKAGDFVADFFTSTNLGQIVYAGAREPVLGLFVVDAGGPPRLMVGPVARGYEHRGPLARRLTDEEARALAVVDAPWTKSYLAPAPAPSAITAERAWTDDGKQVIQVRGPRALGAVVVELLDHHGVPFASRAVTATAASVDVRFTEDQLDRAEGLHVRALGRDHVEALYGGAAFGGAMGYAGEGG